MTEDAKPTRADDLDRFIPPVIRTRDGSVGTKYWARVRRLPARYRRRSHIESFFIALKRITSPGPGAKGRTALFVYAIRRSHQRRKRRGCLQNSGDACATSVQQKVDGRRMQVVSA